jgi:hypothetical protein
MQSWRGGLNPTIGFSAFLMAILLDDVRVVWEASPESVYHQQPMKISKRLGGHVGRPICIAAQAAGSNIHAATTIAAPGSPSTMRTSAPERLSP